MTRIITAKHKHFRSGILILLFIFLDLISKYLVINTLDGVFHVFPGIISLEITRNPGIALGLFTWAASIIPYIIPLGIGVVFFFYWKTSPDKTWEFYGYVCILGGATGNYIDRLITGTVTDFIRLDFFGRFFPYIFNVADVIICTGVGCILLQLILDIRSNSDASGPV